MSIPIGTTVGSGTVQNPTFTTPQVQYLRTCTLLVANGPGSALDLSAFRIKFSIKRTNVQTPNVASIRVYNVSSTTALQIQKSFTRVVLQAGYQGNFGVIFAGTIRQALVGRESATDTFIDIIASDGDLAYNFAVVTTSLPAGTTQQDVVNASIASMSPLGTTAGSTTVNAGQKRVRGKVLYGNARTYLRQVAKNTQSNWSIQNEQVVFVPHNAYLPGTAVVLNANTGMIGSPQQTLLGVNVKCLLNPNIQVSTKVQLDNSTIQRLAIDLTVPGTAANIIAPLTTDGIYFCQVVEHTGDTRGIDWYSNLVMIYIDPALPVQASQEVSYG